MQDAEGNYQNLKTLINHAKSKSGIKLSSYLKNDVDDFRELGNLSYTELNITVAGMIFS